MAMRASVLRSLRLLPMRSARVKSVSNSRLLTTSFYLRNGEEGNGKTSVADIVTITKNANVTPSPAVLEAAGSAVDAPDTTEEQPAVADAPDTPEEQAAAADAPDATEDQAEVLTPEEQADTEIDEMILGDMSHVPVEETSAEEINEKVGGVAEITGVETEIEDLELEDMVLGLASAPQTPDSGFDVDDIMLHDTDIDDTDIPSLTKENEENFNIDEMIMNSAENDSSDFASDSGEIDDDDIATQILSIALDNVPLYGWSDRSIEEAINVLELSPSSTSLFKRGAVELVLYFIEQCNNTLTEHLAAESKTLNLDSDEVRMEFMEKAIKMRLQMLIPYIDSWPQAVRLLASPTAAKDSLESAANTIDEIWYHAGDMATDMSWYTKRGALAAVNVAAEMYMFNDKSPDFADTWEFLHRRMLDLKAAEIAKNSLMHAVNDSIALANSAVTTAQNILGMNSRQR